MKINEIKDASEVESLLTTSSLLTTDLHQNDKIQLFGAYQDENLIACIGVEIYDNTALLRSLAVRLECRSRGIGKKLSEHIEKYCQQKGVKELYLLTETADKYFDRLGYTKQKRQEAPESIKGTTQFSGLCPSSSKFMKKRVND
jgi:amino-acid N-acetyltransferase